jgi:hypothetical protein
MQEKNFAKAQPKQEKSDDSLKMKDFIGITTFKYHFSKL